MRRVIFDCGFLSLLLHPTAKVPSDPVTGAPVTQAAERIEHLIEMLESEGAQIIVPSPMLAEFLVRSADAGPAYLSELNTNSTFKVEPFDQMAAIECAALEERARARDNKRGSSLEPWQKVKVDRQIVAIAVVQKADCVFSDDAGIVALCGDIGLKVFRVSELSLPPIQAEQLTLDTATASEMPSSDSELLSGQSPAAEPPTAPEPERDRQIFLRDDLEPPPPDSSPGAPPRPRSDE